MELIKVKCLKHVYPDQTAVSLCGLEFIVNKGDRISLLGPNGSGKTTLLSHILGLLKPVEGVVEVMGLKPYENFNQIRKHIGVVFQNVDEQIIGPRVYDDIAFSLRSDGVSKKEVDQRVMMAAQTLRIEHLLEKIPHYLSGGQKKKVALAGALATMPDIIILDEPFDALDPKSKKEMIDIINHLNKAHGVTLITTTHDIDIVPKIADTIYVLSEGNIAAKGTPQEIFSNMELLEKAHLEPPTLTDLFFRLQKRGFDTTIPTTVDEAEAQVIQLIK